jgi:hypothetical protein
MFVMLEMANQYISKWCLFIHICNVANKVSHELKPWIIIIITIIIIIVIIILSDMSVICNTYIYFLKKSANLSHSYTNWSSVTAINKVPLMKVLSVFHWQLFFFLVKWCQIK